MSSAPERRSSLLSLDHWLDKCTDDEPDSIIYEPEFAERLKVNRVQLGIAKLEALCDVVLDVSQKGGLPPAKIEENLDEVTGAIITYMETVCEHVQNDFEKLCQYKQELLDQYQKMLKDLYLPPYEPTGDLTVVQHCKLLKSKFNELNIVREKRLARLKELRDRQVRLCLALGIQTPPLKTVTDIPTEDELCSLNKAVLDLEKEEQRRKEKYALLKGMILKCVDQLEYEPVSDSERTILSEEPQYTESFLSRMSQYHSKLETLFATNQLKYDKLKARLESLFDRLDVDPSERKNFFDEHSTCKPSTMGVMEIEIERYEEIKRQNIGKFIEKIKEELVEEYERCFISQDEQDNFLSLGNESEELLELHERELDRMKKYYEDNKEILEKFHKWRSMWKELIDLEVKATDPNRFNNRGGQLLIEEKKRKTLQKGLPKIEKELMALNEKHSQSTGNKFKVFDSFLDEFISGCWDELNHAKEEEKKERQRAKMNETVGKANRTRQPPSQVILKRTPTKRGPQTGVTPTPSKLSCQRNNLGTPASSMLRLNQIGLSASAKKSSALKPRINNQIVPPRPVVSRPIVSNGKSGIPVPQQANSDVSAVSLSEQEFVDMIVTCPASARRPR